MNQLVERKYVIIGLFILIGLSFLLRLFYIQVIDDSYKLDAKNQAFRYITQYPDRGYIYDRNGKLLVSNEIVYDLMVIPHEVKDIDTCAFCDLMGITKDEFIKRVKRLAFLNTSRRPSVFAKQLSPEKYGPLLEQLYQFHGFYTQSRTLRKYPMKIAAHVLGYIGEVSKRTCEKNPYYKEGDYIGINGIERAYEKELRGVKGMKIVMVDVHNREVGSYKNGKYDTLAVPGENLTSTLDANLQLYGQQLMQNKVGSIVAIEPATGDILALVSSPTYDPNLLVGRARSKNYAKLALDSIRVPLFNRALMAQYPPGSTFKPVQALIAQQEGVLFPGTHYYCDGGFHLGHLTVKCDAAHGSLDLLHGLQYSCNAYFCNVFRSMINNSHYDNPEDAYKAWRKDILSFGFGTRLGIDLPHVLSGNIPKNRYYDHYFGKGSWGFSNIVSLSIGQGEIEVTPLQLANEAAIIANRGFYYIPHVIQSIGKKKVKLKKYTTRHYTVVDHKYFKEIVDAMQAVVDGGTAAGSKIPGIAMCGKTGTAQNPHGPDNSLFIAFAPKDNPKIAVAVVVERGGWGASWAAPIASLMIEKYLRDSISRPALEKRMLDGNLLAKYAKAKR